MNCKDLEENLSFYLYDEMPEEQHAACDAHLGACPRCRSLLDESRRLEQLLSERPPSEPAPELLVRCRQALDQALDREQLGWRSLLREWLPAVGIVHPFRAVTALTLLVFGFGLGWTLRPRAGGIVAPTNVVDRSSVAGPDLGDARISGISQVAPDPQTGEVRITLNAERRVTMEGSLDDPAIRQVMVYALKSYDNPGIRLDTLEALRARSGNPSVQPALLYALRHDPNLGIRLEALRAVRKMDWSPEVREALLDVVRHDGNPGLRGTVVDELVKRATTDQDKTLMPLLEHLATNDSNRCVRIKAVHALLALGASNDRE